MASYKRPSLASVIIKCEYSQHTKLLFLALELIVTPCLSHLRNRMCDLICRDAAEMEAAVLERHSVYLKEIDSPYGVTGACKSCMHYWHALLFMCTTPQRHRATYHTGIPCFAYL